MDKQELLEKWQWQALKCLTEPQLKGDSQVMLQLNYEDLGELALVLMHAAMTKGITDRLQEYYTGLARKCREAQAEVDGVMAAPF